ILHELCGKNWIGTASTGCLRRECFERVALFDTTLEFGEEYDMWIRIAPTFDFRYIDKSLVRYGVHLPRLSTYYARPSSGSERHLIENASFFATDKANYSRRFVSLGWMYCQYGMVGPARKSFLKAIALYAYAFKAYSFLGLSLFGTRVFKSVSGPGRGPWRR